jgi:serine/threonine-protein kinase RsbW
MAQERKLTLPAVIGSLQLANAFVRSLAAEARLDRHKTYQLRLAVEELLTNIIKHGYGTARPEGQIALEGHVSDHRVSVRLVDTAARFDPVQAPDPADLDRPLRERRIGSLGLYLARQSADLMFYEYVDGANRTTVVVDGTPAGVRHGSSGDA